MRVPPSVAAASKTRDAPRRCCNSQSLSSTSFGNNRDRPRSIEYPRYKSAATIPITIARGSHSAAPNPDGSSPGADRPKRSPAAKPAAAHKNVCARARSPARAAGAGPKALSDRTSCTFSPERRAAPSNIFCASNAPRLHHSLAASEASSQTRYLSVASSYH